MLSKAVKSTQDLANTVFTIRILSRLSAVFGLNKEVLPCLGRAEIRGATRNQIRSFFEHRSKGGGVISMFKNFGANFV